MKTYDAVVATAEDMERLGEQIGRRLRGGETLELISDLGGGKTTLTRGITRGAGSNDIVGSPTFTLSKVYQAPKFDIHHFDFYRLNEAGLMAHELQDVLGDSKTVVIIEWGEVVGHVLPEHRLTVRIQQTPEGARKVACHYPATLEYLVNT